MYSIELKKWVNRMSVYSPYIVYPPEADELFDCPQDDCENCTFDCDIKSGSANEVD